MKLGKTKKTKLGKTIKKRNQDKLKKRNQDKLKNETKHTKKISKVLLPEYFKYEIKQYLFIVSKVR